MSSVDDRPLFGPGDIADVFMFVADGAKKRDIRSRARKEHTIEDLFNRHSTPEGRRGVCWDIVVDGSLMPLTVDWFDYLPDPAHVRFANTRSSHVLINSKHPRGQNYPIARDR